MESWDRIDAVQRMQDYIEQNIDKQITLYELSRCAGWAFSKEFGISPQKYRKDSPPIYLFMPHSIREFYHYLMKGEQKMDKKSTNTVFVQVIERPERKLILKRGTEAEDYFAYCEEVGCDIWGLLCSIKEALYEPIGMWLPAVSLLII